MNGGGASDEFFDLTGAGAAGGPPQSAAKRGRSASTVGVEKACLCGSSEPSHPWRWIRWLFEPRSQYHPLAANTVRSLFPSEVLGCTERTQDLCRPGIPRQTKAQDRHCNELPVSSHLAGMKRARPIDSTP